MSRRLDDLSASFRPLAVELLARLVEAQIPVLIVDTLRTEAEHRENLRRGTSWTERSLHLDGIEFRGTGEAGSDAIDVAPFETYALHGPDKLQWNADDPVWLTMGTIGEGLGLRWGGRWTQRDLGHFELVRR